jgi:hypothetical protein
MSTPNEKQCCPKFDPIPWEDKEIRWDNKMFIKDTTFCIFHIPLNFGSMMKRACSKIEKAGANHDMKDWVMLSYDPSPWKGEHYLAVTKDVPDCENVKISGTFLTKVFEGPYKEAGKWYKEMEEFVKNKGKEAKKIYFYYTTCPKCAKKWGKNYVVGLAQID